VQNWGITTCEELYKKVTMELPVKDGIHVSVDVEAVLAWGISYVHTMTELSTITSSAA
jgi:hypothetical protein